MTIPGKNTEIYTNIRPITGVIRRGCIISIDPSIGSSSSQPAYAAYTNGELITSAKAEIDPSLPIWTRCILLAQWVRNIYKAYSPDVLVFEEIPDQRYLGRIGGGSPVATGNNVKAHASLLKAVGVILSVQGPDHVLPMRPQVWKARVTDDYVKGDIEDAVQIGQIAIDIAKEIEDTEGEYKYGKSRARRNEKRQRRVNR